MRERGLFITLEGIDGTGKSTHLRLLARHLRRRGYKLCVTREPGGTPVGERIRDILLDSTHRQLTALAELTLMYAARHQHLEAVVRPALGRGKIVISDRFNDASFAYQGSGRHLGEHPVRLLDRLICGPTQPDLTLLLDAPPRLALARAEKRRDNMHRRRFEAQGWSFQAIVRKGYLAIARREPQRVKVIRSDRPAAEVQAEIRGIVNAFLAHHGKAS